MSTAIAPWLVRAKISPPRALSSTCRREHLLEILQTESDKAFVVMEAPAGFGKTQLLAQWRDQLQGGGELVAWYSFDSSDEAAQIPPYLAFAFHRAGLDMSESGLLSGAYLDVRSQQALPIFMQQLERSDRPCTLIMDDMERCTPQLIEQVIEPALRLRAENLRLCMAWRSNPGIALASYELDGDLCRLEANALRFTQDEVSRVLGRSFSAKQTASSFAVTEGWPAALQMLRVGLDRGIALAPDAFLAHEDPRSSDYLQQQLLDSMSEEHQVFLSQCAALDPVNAQLADYAGERSDSARLMPELDYLQGLFAPLDEDRDSYRLHPMLRDFLVVRFERDFQAQFGQLMQRAASWYAQRGEILKAMHCAIDCGQPSLAADIFERAGGLQLWVYEGMWRVIRALELLEKFSLDDHPRTLLAHVLVRAKAGDLIAANEYMERAGRASNDFHKDRPGGDDSALALEYYLMRTTLAQYGCTPSRALLAAPDAAQLQEQGQSEPVLRGYIGVFQCVTESQLGQFDRALANARTAIEDFRKGGSDYGELFMYLHMGQVDFARGDSVTALKQYETAGSMAARSFPGDKALQAIVDVLVGELYRERAESSRAAVHYQRLKKASLSEAWFDIYMAAYEGMAGHLLDTQGLDAANEYLLAAIEHAHTQKLPRLNRFLRALQVRNLLREGAARELSTELIDRIHSDYLQLVEEPEVTWREREQSGLAWAGVCVQNNQLSEASSVAEQLLIHASEIGNVRMGARAEALRMLVRWYEQDRNKAFGDLIRLVTDPQTGGFVRGLLDLGAMLSRSGMLDQAQWPTDWSRENCECIEALKSQFGASAGDRMPDFNERERQILSCLAQGQPDKLIARALGISAHGVRYHLKKLYQKLGVHNRTEALVQAQSQGIVDSPTE